MLRLHDARPIHLRDLCDETINSAPACAARTNEGSDWPYSSRSAEGKDVVAADVGEDGGTQQNGRGERDQSSIETESIDQFSYDDKTGQDADVTGTEDQGRPRAATLGG